MDQMQFDQIYTAAGFSVQANHSMFFVNSTLDWKLNNNNEFKELIFNCNLSIFTHIFGEQCRNCRVGVVAPL